MFAVQAYKIHCFNCLKCAICWHFLHSQRCTPITTIYTQNISINPERNPGSSQNSSFAPEFSSPSPLVTTLCFLSYASEVLFLPMGPYCTQNPSKI